MPLARVKVEEFGRLLDAWGAVRTDHKIENVAVVEEAVDSV